MGIGSSFPLCDDIMWIKTMPFHLTSAHYHTLRVRNREEKKIGIRGKDFKNKFQRNIIIMNMTSNKPWPRVFRMMSSASILVQRPLWYNEIGCMGSFDFLLNEFEVGLIPKAEVCRIYKVACHSLQDDFRQRKVQTIWGRAKRSIARQISTGLGKFVFRQKQTKHLKIPSSSCIYLNVYFAQKRYSTWKLGGCWILDLMGTSLLQVQQTFNCDAC